MRTNRQLSAFPSPCAMLAALLLSIPASLLGLPALASAGAALTGSWSGSFTVGQEDTRALVFHFEQTADGYTALLDMPTQGASGIRVDSVSLQNNELTLIIPSVQAEFYGTLRWNPEHTRVIRIDGDWNQVGEYVAVSLHPEVPNPR